MDIPRQCRFCSHYSRKDETSGGCDKKRLSSIAWDLKACEEFHPVGEELAVAIGLQAKAAVDPEVKHLSALFRDLSDRYGDGI